MSYSFKRRKKIIKRGQWPYFSPWKLFKQSTWKFPPKQLNVGDKVKVINQDITGTVLRIDNNKITILDDDNSWQDKGEEPSLTFRENELKLL